MLQPIAITPSHGLAIYLFGRNTRASARLLLDTLHVYCSSRQSYSQCRLKILSAIDADFTGVKNITFYLHGQAIASLAVEDIENLRALVNRD